MAEQLMKYDAFYKSKHSGRVLDWEHSLGTATLKARFAKGYKELSVSLFQAVVLLLFNDADELSYSEISESVRMGELKSFGIVWLLMEYNREGRVEENTAEFGLWEEARLD